MKTNVISLNTKATIGLILISVFSIFCLMAIFQTIVHKEISLIEQEVVKKEVESIIAGVSRHLSSVERLANNMAELGKQLPKNKKLYHNLFPRLLEKDNIKSHIAGGGIWPEPFEFNKKIKRRSFFWGRGANGQLKYYDDYNDPKGNGYRGEEWYVPAKYITNGITYWSRSYMDPFTYEAMVTAAVPFKNKKGVFSGVATVDIKLSGLNTLFKKHTKHTNGYIFALDRNNVFLSFPDNLKIKPYSIKNNKPSGQYFTLKEFILKYKEFSIYADHIKNKRAEYSIKISENHAIKKLATLIQRESYQINYNEALRIAVDLKSKHTDEIPFDSSLLYIDYDPVLKTDAIASIHYLPKYHWFVAIITPRSIIMSKVDNTTKNIFFWILLTILVIFILVYVIFNNIIMKPLKITGEILEKNINSKSHEQLPVITNDEIGQLAILFNQYSSMIEKSRNDADKANNAKSEFLSRMSHELRTPLNAIIGFSQLLEMEDSIDEEHKDNINEINKAGNHLLFLVNDLIDISRIENDIAFLDIKPNSLNAILQDTIALIKPIQQKQGVTIDDAFRYSENLSVIVDNMAIKQVFINIITNAIKYNKQNGTIKISCKKDGSNAQIDITDSGIGISKDKLDAIFEPFNRLGKEYSNIEGTGIGLYITKKLLYEMQGSISASSEINIGSTFTIRVPLSIIEVQDDKQQIKKNDNVDSLKYNAKKILIVEDILSNQKILQLQIKKFGYDAEIAANGKIALELINKNNYDLILTDCTMPVMDGFQLTQRVRKHKDPKISNIPIIAISANAMAEIEQKCLASGMNSYVSKPVDIELLKQIIDKQLHINHANEHKDGA
ncbi:hypothetical protein MNBD_GAMMA22-95 [hydrothermal vent metagenome]|uniref:histidine kinase n=1 Tax=hydrothermal vent metagenome TaxID=652676 RepID=A0A3B1ALH6_9ZZZZ